AEARNQHHRSLPAMCTVNCVSSQVNTFFVGNPNISSRISSRQEALCDLAITYVTWALFGKTTKSRASKFHRLADGTGCQSRGGSAADGPGIGRELGWGGV